MDVEHLWHYNEMELNKLNTDNKDSVSKVSHPFLVESGLAGSADASSGLDFVANLCNIADHRLYKIVKWCKSLPLFKNISVSQRYGRCTKKHYSFICFRLTIKFVYSLIHGVNYYCSRVVFDRCRVQERLKCPKERVSH